MQHDRPLTQQWRRFALHAGSPLHGCTVPILCHLMLQLQPSLVAVLRSIGCLI